jgi:DNA-directed RNA polymerase subunit omega
LNTELLRQALEKVTNPNILVNLISRRVRQLNSGGGTGSRPLITDTGTLGAADIALSEFVQDKMSWEVITDLPGNETPAAKRRRRG